MTPKISVIIPSYNKVKFIGRTLDSIFDQDYPNLEVVIQDGESTDGTLEIIKKYNTKYSKLIRLESKHDGGQLNAVKDGLTKATGELLTFINADDQYASDAFKTVVNEFVEHRNSLWFVGKGIVVNENNAEIAKPVMWYKSFLLTLNSYTLLLTTNYLMQPSVFFTREAYQKYGPFIGTRDFIMEYDLWLKLGRVSMPRVINKTLSKFRIEASTKTKTLSLDLLKEDEKVIRQYTKNLFILLLHKLNNLGRILVGRFV